MTISPNERLEKLRSLTLELEEVGEMRKKLWKEKVLAEAILSDKEDISRDEALSSEMAVSKIPLFLKHHTQLERKALHKAESNFKAVQMRWEITVEVINSLKFDMRFEETLANNNNF